MLFHRTRRRDEFPLTRISRKKQRQNNTHRCYILLLCIATMVNDRMLYVTSRMRRASRARF